MRHFTDPEYLKNKQYADSANLNARIRLHQLYDTNPYSLQMWTFSRMLEGAPSAPSPYRVLELGCGTGELWTQNRHRIPQDRAVVLSDFSQGMLNDARARLSDVGFQYCAIDAQEIPFSDQTFDVVAAHFMLYHVPNRVKAISEIRRVLKPSGVFYAITLGKNHMRELHEMVHGIAPGIFPPDDVGSHPFCLENGAEQLRAMFGHVELIRYDCALQVTNPQHLVEYAQSMNVFPEALTGDHIERLRQNVQKLIVDHGSFVISKDTGLFAASGHKRG